MAYLSKQEQAASSRRHYERNVERIKARARAFTKAQILRLTEIVLEAKAIPCADCGKRYPHYVMDFDHVSDDKEANVSDLKRSGVSESRLLAEIAKCEVVCANCHRARTWKRSARTNPTAAY